MKSSILYILLFAGAVACVKPEPSALTTLPPVSGLASEESLPGDVIRLRGSLYKQSFNGEFVVSILHGPKHDMLTADSVYMLKTSPSSWLAIKDDLIKDGGLFNARNGTLMKESVDKKTISTFGTKPFPGGTKDELVLVIYFTENPNASIKQKL